jgi:hypothetical protein
MTLNAVGDLERGRGEHSRAGARYEESLALFAELRLADQQQVLLHNLGYVALAAGNDSLAATRFMGAARAYQRLGDRRGISECLLGLGATAAAGGRYADAVRLFAAGEAGLQQVHAELWHSNRTDYEHWQGVARAGLDAAAFDRAWAEGLSLALDEVLALALS